MKNRSHRNCALEFINPNGGSGSRSLARHRDSDWGSDIFPTFPGTPDNRFVSHTFRTQSSWIHGSGDPPNRSAPIRSSKEYVHVLEFHLTMTDPIHRGPIASTVSRFIARSR